MCVLIVAFAKVVDFVRRSLSIFPLSIKKEPSCFTLIFNSNISSHVETVLLVISMYLTFPTVGVEIL